VSSVGWCALLLSVSESVTTTPTRPVNPTWLDLNAQPNTPTLTTHAHIYIHIYRCGGRCRRVSRASRSPRCPRKCSRPRSVRVCFCEAVCVCVCALVCVYRLIDMHTCTHKGTPNHATTTQLTTTTTAPNPQPQPQNTLTQMARQQERKRLAERVQWGSLLGSYRLTGDAVTDLEAAPSAVFGEVCIYICVCGCMYVCVWMDGSLRPL
jgi:hypothetical protein